MTALRVWIGRMLRIIVAWVEPRGNLQASLLLLRAAALAAEAERAFGDGYGEAKRHQVYARLIKDFPLVAKRAISRAIEDAL